MEKLQIYKPQISPLDKINKFVSKIFMRQKKMNTLIINICIIFI